jgi:protein-S-isoprenylcysteine O-methyltransferase Ste14
MSSANPSEERRKVGMLIPPPILLLALIAACAVAQVVWFVRPTSPTTAIVSEGPYRFSRNPMYLGMAGLLAGLGVLLGSPCFAAGLIVFLVVIHFGVVLREERYLESLHGETYRQYKRQVRRWV